MCGWINDNRLDAKQLMAEARRQTGLADFGEGYFREPLERLVASINAESQLSEHGKISVPASILRNLTIRLSIEDWYRRHPEIDDQEIVAPLFIIGLPRTGTTARLGVSGAGPRPQRADRGHELGD